MKNKSIHFFITSQDRFSENIGRHIHTTYPTTMVPNMIIQD